LGVQTVTIGVFEHNDIAHSCYKKVGFVAQEIVPHERDNIIEMAITKEEYLLLTKL
jgi:ribosomal protein S18 acetylase RimI-like enzyme